MRLLPSVGIKLSVIIKAKASYNLFIQTGHLYHLSLPVNFKHILITKIIYKVQDLNSQR